MWQCVLRFCRPLGSNTEPLTDDTSRCTSGRHENGHSFGQPVGLSRHRTSNDVFFTSVTSRAVLRT